MVNVMDSVESTRGHSVLHYGFTPRRFATDAYAPEYIPRRIYDTSAEEYALDTAVSHATSYSDASLYDTYDTAYKSRGRDQKLLSDTTAAIPPSTYSPMMATSSRTATSLPRRRFLSHPSRSYTPDFDDSFDTPKKSGPSLPTSHIQASAPPRPNITPTFLKYSKTPSIPKTATRIASLKGTYDDGLSSVLPEKSSRLLGGYIPRSLYRSGSPLGSGTSSPMYRSSYTGMYPEYKTSYHSGSGTPTYRPSAYSQSTSLLAGYVPRRLAHRVAAGSPYGSGTQSPALYKSKFLVGGHVAPKLSSLSPLGSPYASGAQSPITYTTGEPRASYDTYIINDPEYPDTSYPSYRSYSSGRRPKVVGTKKHVGNYYDRLRRKRAGKQGSSKYWPYYNVEDITSEAGDVMSETASLPGYYENGVDHWEGGGAVGGYVDTYDKYDTYDPYDSYGDSFNDSYMDEPGEYVPFKPRRRLESPGVLELSPYEDTPPAPELPLVSTVPYVPSVSSNLNSSSKANDLYFNSLVSSSTARARTAFKNNGWNGYDNASLVLSVEGDVVAPDTGGRYGFKYYHPPVPLVGRGIGDSLLGLPSPSTSAVDTFFGTYLNKLKDLRTDIRNTLDSRIVTRPVTSAYKEIGTYTPSKPSDSFLPYTSYRKRLQGGAAQRVDVIELPVSERVLPSETLSLTFPDTTSEHDKNKRDTSYKLTVLDKIKIKVSSEPHTVSPRASVAARRVVARKTTPPPAKPFYPIKTEVASYPTSQSLAYYTPRPRTVIVIGAKTPWQGVYVLPYGPQVRAPQYLGKSEPRPARVQEELWPYPVVYRGRSVISSPAKNYSRPKRAQAPPRYRLRYLPSGYVTYRIPRRAKAAIVASTVEVEPRRKRPRSKFAADKLRRTGHGKSEESVQPVYTSGLHASRPPMPLPSDRRAIRDVEGFTKPRNLLSWQYRLESRIDPTDIIYKPGTFVRMRDQVRDAQDKLDRHRQLLDRYLSDSGPAYDVQGSVQRKMEELERRDPTFRSPVSVGRDRPVVFRPSPCVIRKKKY